MHFTQRKRELPSLEVPGENKENNRNLGSTNLFTRAVDSFHRMMIFPGKLANVLILKDHSA